MNKKEKTKIKQKNTLAKYTKVSQSSGTDHELLQTGISLRSISKSTTSCTKQKCNSLRCVDSLSKSSLKS